MLQSVIQMVAHQLWVIKQSTRHLKYKISGVTSRFKLEFCEATPTFLPPRVC